MRKPYFVSGPRHLENDFGNVEVAKCPPATAASAATTTSGVGNRDFNLTNLLSVMGAAHGLWTGMSAMGRKRTVGYGSLADIPYPAIFRNNSPPPSPPNAHAMSEGDYLLGTRDREVSRHGRCFPTPTARPYFACPLKIAPRSRIHAACCTWEGTRHDRRTAETRSRRDQGMARHA